MNINVRNILNKTKGKKIGLFVDNANWFYPQRELRYRISFTKLRKFLERYYKVVTAKIYAGTPLDIKDRKTFSNFCKAVEKAGFIVKTKPLKKIWLDRKKNVFVYKCNFDVEIALDVARYIDRVDLVIIGSGDSDFLEVKEFALERKKGFIALCFEKGVAWEVRKGYHLFIEELREFLEKL